MSSLHCCPLALLKSPEPCKAMRTSHRLVSSYLRHPPSSLTTTFIRLPRLRLLFSLTWLDGRFVLLLNIGENSAGNIQRMHSLRGSTLNQGIVQTGVDFPAFLQACSASMSTVLMRCTENLGLQHSSHFTSLPAVKTCPTLQMFSTLPDCLESHCANLSDCVIHHWTGLQM